MIEIVNPSHPDKVADRIAGALVDYCYTIQDAPKVAVEILAGHGRALIIIESSVEVPQQVAEEICDRIGGGDIETVDLLSVPQDAHLANNQTTLHAGDNGIFKGVKADEEEQKLAEIARAIYTEFPTDGKYILDGDHLIVCQSHADNKELADFCHKIGDEKGIKKYTINPLGEWTGGLNVDSGATNRKLGSDMGKSVTGGGLHGKDLSKADISLNLYAFMHAKKDDPCEISCAIGDEFVDYEGKKLAFKDAVSEAEKIVKSIGGFEKFAEWGFHSPIFD